MGRFNNATAQIQNDLQSLKQEAHKEGINVKLAAAAEVRLDIELMAMVMANKLPFIGKIADKNVLLLELNGHNTLITWNEARQNIQRGCFTRACTTRYQDIHFPHNRSIEKLRHLWR